MNIHDIAAADLGSAVTAADAWSSAATDLRATGGDLRSTGTFDDWGGTASDAMRHRVDSSANRMLAVSVATFWASVVLRHHVSVLTVVKHQVRMTLAAASATGMVVAPDGTVSTRASSALFPALAALAAAWTVALKACRNVVLAIDAAGSSVLSAVCSVENAPTVTPVQLAPGAAAELVAGPAAAADTVVMPSGLNAPLSTAQEQQLRNAVASARTELALRGLDPEDVGVSVEQVNGVPVVTAGDIRTADTVTTLVSGVGSSADGAVVGTGAAAGRIAGPGHAVIAWHGYTAPDGVRGGLDPSFAADGAPALRELQAVLREDSADGAELQVVAHSYGSTLLGAAAGAPENPLQADTVHLIGSPGTGHDRAGDMHIDGGHRGGQAEVHAWRAPGDLIGAATGTAGGVHGVDPTASRFGADTVNGLPSDHQGGTIGRILERMTDGYLWLQGEWDSHSSYLSDEYILEQVR